MNKYEIMFILKSNDVEAINTQVSELKAIITDMKGEIVNEKIAIATLSAFLDKIDARGKLGGCHSVFSVPCGVTPEMMEKFSIVAKKSGITKAYFVETPILSALGQRIPLNDSSPCFIVEMGGGITNIAAVSLDGVIAGISVNFGSNKISTDIIDYVAETYGLQIGLLTAERLKKEIASLAKNDGLTTVVNFNACTST